MKRTIWNIILFLLVASLLCFGASAAWQADVVVNNCEEASNWDGHGLSLRTNQTDAREGQACLEFTVDRDFWINTAPMTPVDATGANALALELYVSSAQDFYASSVMCLELTSSGQHDVEESAWELTKFDIEDGWNSLVLPLSETDGGCDLSRINHIRFYSLGAAPEQPLTLRLDHIRLTYVNSELDMGDHVIGKQDGATATPVMKDVVLNTPYDPWSKPSQDQTVTGNEEKPPIMAIVGATLAGVALIVAVALLIVTKNKKMKIVVCGGCAAVLAVGVLLVVLAPSAPAVNVDTPTHPFFITDQTGHPELGASEVDVESLLTIAPNYSYINDYKIRYQSSPVLTDFSSLPHLLMRESGVVQSGLSLYLPSGNQPEFLHLRGMDCRVFQCWDETDVFSIAADETTRTAYGERDIVLNMVVYVTEEAKLTVEYVDQAGEKRSLVAECDRMREWMVLSIALPDIALEGALAGNDISVTFKQTEMIRMHAIYLDEATEAVQPQIGLIHTTFETDSYIVADANVLAFGATGNGYTDDTKAFQEAIDYVATLGGGTVFVPAGYYCLTQTLTLPESVGLVGELEPGTARGSVLCIYGGKGTTDVSTPAVLMNHQSAVIQLAFWYPEQTFANGRAIPYPPTLVQNGSESVTIRNVTLVNSYIGIDFAKNANNSLQYVRDVYGTCLETGYINNNSFDIGRIENVTFTPDVWLSSGLPGTPNASLLRTYMLRNSTGLVLQRIDWTYLADITVEGYHKGVLCTAGELGSSNGHMYGVDLLDCYYGLYADRLSWMLATDCTWRAAGGEGATPLYIEEGCVGKISLSNCELSTGGANALLNFGKCEIALMDCDLSSASESTYVPVRGMNDTLIHTALSGNASGAHVLTETGAPTLPGNVDYSKTVVTKPASDAFIDLSKEPYCVKAGEDITERLQGAIDAMKGTGGTVYIPAGQYRLSDYIEVHAGIEVRGAVAWPQNLNATSFLTRVGENDPDGRALFTLYGGAGLRGLAVIYEEQHTAIKPYSYTVRGDGEGIYLVAVSLPTSWRGVDFATNRCDNHYIEYLWMAPVDIGIIVGGGSENGIIRDCHFTPNTWCLRGDEGWWDKVYNVIMDRSRPYVIGESKNQILYHNFVYGAREGLSVLDGAENVYLLCHGVDSGYTSAHFSGDCSVVMVDAQLVNLHKNNPKADMHYLVTADDFTGELTMINSSFWGSTQGAWRLHGSGRVVMYGVQMHSAGLLMCDLKGGELALYGMLESSHTKDFFVGEKAQALILSGNVFPGGLQIEKDENTDADISGEDIGE